MTLRHPLSSRRRQEEACVFSTTLPPTFGSTALENASTLPPPPFQVKCDQFLWYFCMDSYLGVVQAQAHRWLTRSLANSWTKTGRQATNISSTRSSSPCSTTTSLHPPLLRRGSPNVAPYRRPPLMWDNKHLVRLKHWMLGSPRRRQQKQKQKQQRENGSSRPCRGGHLSQDIFR